MATRRLIFFGGQGSRQLCSSRGPAPTADSETNSELALLLSACHAAFLQEAFRARSPGIIPAWTKFEPPASPETLLNIPPEHQANPIFQGVCLCVTQLRAYLASDPDLEIDDQSVVAGFCSGILPAIVLATSNNLDQYISNSQQAVRLAYWIGYRVAELSQQIGGQQWHRYPWAVSILGMGQDDLEQKTAEFNDPLPQHLAVRISARCADRSFTVVGEGQTLRRFQEECLASGHPAEPVFVHAIYHAGDAGRQAVEKVCLDVFREGISFPQSTSLERPLLSCQTGRLLEPTSSESFLSDILQSILVEPANLQTTWSNAAEMIRSSPDKWEIVTVGPGARTLLSLPSREDPRPPDTSLVDLPGTMREGNEDGFAIVGMSVNLPGGSNKEDFWALLEQGLNAAEHIPSHRFDVEAYRGDGPRQLNAQHGNFVTDPFALDHRFFGISPREAKSMDPQQKMLLHGAVTALEDAGYVPSLSPSFNPETIGCYIGAATEDYVQNLTSHIDVYYSTGTLRAFLSGKLSYAHGWSGPSMVIDTACSSSLVAIASACRALAHGDCSTALAGGVNAITSPDMYIGLSRAHFLSPTGQCRPFDESADGYCRAEGCGLFVIKRLQDAIGDNDRIYGVIRDIEVNQSGNASSITHPHGETQVALFHKLLSRSSVDSQSIGVIEAHGTGTQAGDAVEAASIESVFSDPRHLVHLTSIKGNIGHAEAASGSASLAKLLLMLQHAKIPPQVGLKVLNPKLHSLESHNIRIPTKLLDWPSSKGPRRALLNNFGASGSNAALIVEEFRGECRTQRRAPERTAYNWTVSAKTTDALRLLIEGYRRFLRKEKDNIRLDDLCFTATARRQLYDYRLSLVCESISDLLQQLDESTGLETIRPCSKSPAPTVFVFSGQGSFYLGMGKQLLHTAPVFGQTVTKCDEILRQFEYDDVLPSQIINGTGEVTSVNSQVVASQVACFVVEVALMSLLMSWNIHPDIVLGHSLGEYAAMVASEVLTVEDALALVVFRAKLMVGHCALGHTTMLACNQSSLSIQTLLDEQPDLLDISIACDNGETALVVSGPVSAIDTLSQRLKDQNIRCKKLDVPLGFHSPALDSIVEPLHAFAQGLSFSKPSKPLGSCLYGRILGEEDEIDADYIVQQMRSPVQFRDLAACLARDARYESASYVEIGPAPITLPMLKPTLGSGSSVFLLSLVRDQDAWKTLCQCVRQLGLRSNTVCWPQVFKGTGTCIIDIPHYPFQPSSVYVKYEEPSAGKSLSPSKLTRPSSFSLLDQILQCPGSDGTLKCQTDLSILGEYIRGHMVAGHPLCPASVYHSMVLEAVHWDDKRQNSKIAVVSDITFGSPLVANQTDQPFSVRLSIDTASDIGRFTFSKDSASEKDVTENATLCSGWVSWRSQSELTGFLGRKLAYVKRQMAHLEQGQSQANLLSRNLIYNVIFPRVVSYSEPYQCIQQLWIAGDGQEGHGKFRLPANSFKGGVVAPAFVDTLLHGAGFMANSQARPTDAYICSKVDSIVVAYEDIEPEQVLTLYCSVLDCNDGELLGEAYAIMPNGTVVAGVEGMHFKRLNLRAFVSHLSRQVNQDKKSINNKNEPSPVALPTCNSRVSREQEDSSSSDLRKVVSIVARVSELQAECITERTRLTELGMDSLMRIELSQAIQTAFPHLQLESDILQAETVQEIWRCVQDSKTLTSETSSSSSSRDTTDGESSISTPIAGSDYDNDPSSDVCSALMQILHNTCEISLDSLTPNTAMDSLGIDSLMTIELQQTFHSAFGVAVSHEELSSEQTIAELGVKLGAKLGKKNPAGPSDSKDSVADAKRCTVPLAAIRQLQNGPDHLPPLILFHDGSGLVEKYQKLHPIGCTVLAVQNPVLDGQEHWATTLGDMARHYAISLMNRGIPKQVIVGGWSFGGVLAHEVANKLDSHGYDVAGVILIDSPSPQDHQPLPKEVVDYVLDRKSLPSQTLSTMKAQFNQHAQLLGRYRPLPVQPTSRLYIMLQNNGLLDTSRLCGVNYPWLEDPDSRAASIAQWQEIAGHSVPVLEIPGNHFQAFDEKNIQSVSDRIQQTYRDIVQHCSQ